MELSIRTGCTLAIFKLNSMKKLLFLFSVLLLINSCEKKVSKKNDTVEQETNLLAKEVDADLSSGTLMRVENFPTNLISPRRLDIWLPNNYSKEKKYAVLYMHDGQMLFDSTTTWNKQEWKMDEWATQLMNEGKTKDFIIVAPNNISEIRHSDYFPKKPLQYLKNSDSILDNARRGEWKLFQEDINSDNYLKFIVEEVKPYIDKNYSVLTDRENTFIAGSSMGGLISMYAICEYPDIFGGAACISTHWPGIMPADNNPVPEAFFKYMKDNLPDPDTHKMYFDYGTETLDQHYPQYAGAVDSIFLEGGYTQANFKNIEFKGENHSENAWNKRMDMPLTFLLGQ